mmetsp:Transcript_139551/g.362846  ORF Transcript_139551/g.362846 Transcript_139551/m.362846 type:complete len:458 (-) Transcript_139551:7-1380(-)
MALAIVLAADPVPRWCDEAHCPPSLQREGAVGTSAYVGTVGAGAPQQLMRHPKPQCSTLPSCAGSVGGTICCRARTPTRLRRHRRLGRCGPAGPTVAAALVVLAGVAAAIAHRADVGPSRSPAAALTVRPVRRVAIVGATHGNELTGAWVVRRMHHAPNLMKRSSIEALDAVLGNPRAYQETRRFVDEDLNRQFLGEALSDLTLPSYEAQRAKALAAQFGQKTKGDREEAGASDFLVDLHTTTTAMGVSFIAEPWSPVGLAAACWCQQKLRPRTEAGDFPEVHVILESLDKQSSPHLISVAREGLMIEIGPVPQGVLKADGCRWMEIATSTVMDFLEALNTGADLALPQRAHVFRDIGVKIPAPLSEDGKPAAIFHEDFEGKDFQPLRKGEPMFLCVNGEVICYDGAYGDVIWPVFVNEAAYYLPQSGLGFGVTLHEEVEVPAVTTSLKGVSGTLLA